MTKWVQLGSAWVKIREGLEIDIFIEPTRLRLCLFFSSHYLWATTLENIELVVAGSHSILAQQYRRNSTYSFPPAPPFESQLLVMLWEQLRAAFTRAM